MGIVLTRRLDVRRRNGMRVLHAVLTTAALAAPASAGAATRDVQMGPPPGGERSLKALRSEANAFFPGTVAVHVGDRVRFVPNGYHTVDLPPRRGGPLSFLVPTRPATDVPDAAGRQFWFRGFENLVVHPKLLSSAGRRTQSYDATKRLNSGLPTNDNPQPLTVRFKRRGSYTYFCNIHQGMTGSVRVVARALHVRTTAQDRGRVSRQVAAAIRTAERLARKRTVPRLINVGRSGRGGVERFAFSPSAVTVPPGTAVTFRVSAGSRVAHTATTGPGSPQEAGSYLGDLARSLQGPGVNLIAAYPSEPPTLGVVDLTPRSHGNGFWNSGVMDGITSSPTPGENRVRFSEPGMYRFYCLLHTSMSTVVTVK